MHEGGAKISGFGQTFSLKKSNRNAQQTFEEKYEETGIFGLLDKETYGESTIVERKSDGKRFCAKRIDF